MLSPVKDDQFTALERLDLPTRTRAACWHLVLSFAIAAIAAGLVFGLWYPGPYRLLSGGRELFLLVTGVDVVLGPLLTFAVFDMRKGWPHLRRDLAVIVAIQLAALAYGLHTVYIARPIALIFEVDRFRVVSANDVYHAELPSAPVEFRQLPLTGPWLLSTRAAKVGDEQVEAVFMAIRGVDTSQRPSFWQAFEKERDNVLRRSRPVSALIEKYPEQRALVLDAMESHSLPLDSTKFLPVIARGDWIALVDAAARPVVFLPLDGFF